MLWHHNDTSSGKCKCKTRTAYRRKTATKAREIWQYWSVFINKTISARYNTEAGVTKVRRSVVFRNDTRIAFNWSERATALIVCVLFRLALAIFVPSKGYPVSLYGESLLQPWYNPLWLTGLKAPTNYPSLHPIPHPHLDHCIFFGLVGWFSCKNCRTFSWQHSGFITKVISLEHSACVRQVLSLAKDVCGTVRGTLISLSQSTVRQTLSIMPLCANHTIMQKFSFIGQQLLNKMQLFVSFSNTADAF